MLRPPCWGTPAVIGRGCSGTKMISSTTYARAAYLFCFCSPSPRRLGLRREADVVLSRDVYQIFVIFSLWRAKRVMQPNTDTRQQAGSVYLHVRARLFGFARTFSGDIYIYIIKNENTLIYIVILASGVTHTACKGEYRRNLRMFDLTAECILEYVLRLPMCRSAQINVCAAQTNPTPNVTPPLATTLLRGSRSARGRPGKEGLPYSHLYWTSREHLKILTRMFTRGYSGDVHCCVFTMDGTNPNPNANPNP